MDNAAIPAPSGTIFNGRGTAMKPWLTAGLLSALLLAVSGRLTAAGANADPQPPPLTSELGYLQVATAVALPPDVPRIFIPPQSRLPLLTESAAEGTPRGGALAVPTP
jgi:hypothetical protein